MALLGYAGITLPRTRYPAAGPGFVGNCGGWPTRNPGGICCTSWSTSSSAPSLFACADVGLWWPRRRHVLVLEPLAAGVRPRSAGPARLSRPLRRTHVQYRARRTAVDHGPFVLRTRPAAWGVAYALLVDETPALRQQVSELTQSRTAAGEAEVHTLRRLERDLHDGPQQRLVRLGMDLSAAQRRLDDDPVQARALLDEALQQSQDALAEIRTLSRGIAPPILAEQGLRAAITALAARGTIPTSVEVDDVQLSDAAQNAAYFVVAEAWRTWRSTVGRGRPRSSCRVGALAVINITDDGIGGASLAKGHGLSGLADRLAGVDGTLTVSSPRVGPRS